MLWVLVVQWVINPEELNSKESFFIASKSTGTLTIPNTEGIPMEIEWMEIHKKIRILTLWIRPMRKKYCRGSNNQIMIGRYSDETL